MALKVQRVTVAGKERNCESQKSLKKKKMYFGEEGDFKQ